MDSWFEEKGVFIVLGIFLVVFVILMIVICFLCCKKRFEKKEKNFSQTANVTDLSSQSADGSKSSLSGLTSTGLTSNMTSSAQSSLKGQSSQMATSQASTAKGMVSEGFEITASSAKKGANSNVADSNTSSTVTSDFQSRPIDLKYKPKEDAKSAESARSSIEQTNPSHQ